MRYKVEWRENSSEKESDWEEDTFMGSHDSIGGMLLDVSKSAFVNEGFEHRIIGVRDDGKRVVLE